MVNIEVHGFGLQETTTPKANHFGQKIKYILFPEGEENSDLAKRTKITIFYDTSVAADGSNSPFLRIMHSIDEKPTIGEVVESLRKLGIDIEGQLLTGFYPKPLI